jgi:enamine deaminase RidA (YjgF/YER057c/UK114 family)
MKKILLICLVLVATEKLAAQNPELKLKELGITLPAPSAPVANYVKYVRTGNLVFLSGHGPALTANGGYITGKLGKDLTIDEGYNAAKVTSISLLATLKAAIGDLSKLKRIVKVLGMVNCTESFIDQPKVINGFSDLMVAVFGEKGKHARSAVGMISLPMNMAVEIEMVVEVE